MRLFKKKTLGPVAKGVITSLQEHAEKWRADQHYLYIGHLSPYDAQVRLWIASGKTYLKIEVPMAIELSSHEQEAVWDSIQLWKSGLFCARQFIETLRQAEGTQKPIETSETEEGT